MSVSARSYLPSCVTSLTKPMHSISIIAGIVQIIFSSIISLVFRLKIRGYSFTVLRLSPLDLSLFCRALLRPVYYFRVSRTNKSILANERTNILNQIIQVKSFNIFFALLKKFITVLNNKMQP